MRWRGDLQLNAEAGRNDAVLRNCGRLWTMPQPLTKDAADLMEESGLGLLHPTCETDEPIFPVVVSHSVLSDSLPPHGLQSVRLLCPWGFSRQEYWSGLPCPPSGDLSNPWIEPRSLALPADSILSEPPEKNNM